MEDNGTGKCISMNVVYMEYLSVYLYIQFTVVYNADVQAQITPHIV